MRNEKRGVNNVKHLDYAMTMTGLCLKIFTTVLNSYFHQWYIQEKYLAPKKDSLVALGQEKGQFDNAD